MKRIVSILLALLLFAACAPALPAVSMAESRQVLILMYHSVLRDPARTGPYIISPERLEADIVYLLQNGYETVVLKNLQDFVNGTGELPEKPVVLTFDDGHLNNRTYVLPLLQQYDCRAVLSVVGAYTETYSKTPDPNPNYAYLTWEDVAALRLSDRFEIQNHSYGMHGQSRRMGSGRKSGESAGAYAAAFTADVSKLQSALKSRCGLTPAFFTYPYGVVAPDSRTLLEKMGFAGSLTCREGWNRVTVGKPESLWELRRYNRPGQLDTAAFMETVLCGADAPG